MDTNRQYSLLEAFRSDHPDALDELYRYYYGLLLAKAYIMLQDRALAEEAVQDCFIEFWEHKLYERVHTSLDAFLFMILHRKCVRRIDTNVKRRKKARLYMDEQQKTSQVTMQHIELEEKQSEEKHETAMRQQFQTAFKNLSPLQQKAITLVHLEQKSYQEGADALSIKIDTIKTHLKRALASLRKQLKA